MPELCGMEYEAVAVGNVVYRPACAAEECGFGRWEVHPQYFAVEEDGIIELKHNGHWLIVDRTVETGKSDYFAFKPNSGGRQAAEMMAAFRNFGLPTRVVDLCGLESVSQYTRDIVQKKAKESGIQIPD